MNGHKNLNFDSNWSLHFCVFSAYFSLPCFL